MEFVFGILVLILLADIGGELTYIRKILEKQTKITVDMIKNENKIIVPKNNFTKE